MHERDDERFAMLLERVRTSTLAEVEDGDEVVTVAGRLSLRLAIPAPPDLPRLREQAGAWEERLREDAGELTHSMSRHVVGAAVATVRELKSRALTLLEADDLRKALHRTLDVFAEAAEVDRERAQRWAQFHAVQAAFWGRRHGFRMARGGSRLDWLTEFADRVAELLTR
ncbi:hypothetical protein [Nonomuraea sp. CA-141351]|uniref:hypothetical protein n=1 Tax=Nonomuraea sp. CA-141351 TaxID=3239996 RepID=UPI003D944A9F